MTESTELVGKYYEAWGKGDIDALRPCLAADLRVRGPMQTCDDAEAFLAATKRNAQMFAGADYRPLTRVADGDEVVVLGTLVMGPVELPTAEYFKLAGGKIQEIRLYFDRSALAPPS